LVAIRLERRVAGFFRWADAQRSRPRERGHDGL